MKKLIFILLLLVGCNANAATPHKAQKVSVACDSTNSMLWNPGPCYRADTEQTGDTAGTCDISEISVMSEAGLVGTPNIARPLYCGGVLKNPNGEAPSFSINKSGWGASDYAGWPGYAVWFMWGGNGSPIGFRIFNASSSATTDPCWLKEASVSYVGERDLTDFPGYVNVNTGVNTMTPAQPTVFKGKYDISKFKTITGTFTARLEYASPGSGCASMPTQRVESDFAVQYFDSNRKILRTDVIGVSVFNRYPAANGSEILFASCANPRVCVAIVDGSKLGYPQLMSAFQSYSIEYLSLLNKYLPPPPPGTASSLLILFETYSTGKSMDLVYDVTNMDLVGVEQ